MADTPAPQVFPLLWNAQGQNADGGNKPPPWDPKAAPPQPREATSNMIVQDQANPGKTPIETQVDAIQAHNDVAANALCQKNRKRKQSSMELRQVACHAGRFQFHGQRRIAHDA